MKLRIDPLKIDGTFDTDFYGSEDYKSTRDVLEKYIKDEGFLTKPDTYFINFANHQWQIVISDDPNLII